MSNTYWEDRKKEQINRGNQAADKVVKVLYQEYQSCSNQIKKDLSLFYAMYGRDNILEYQELLKTMTKAEVDMLYKEIDKFFEKYEHLNHLRPVREKYYQFTRLQGLRANILMNMVELGDKEEIRIKKMLENVFKDTYYRNIYHYQRLTGFDGFNQINDRVLKNLLKEKWIAGDNYSGRIWKNKDELLNVLEREFIIAVAKGDAADKVIKLIEEKMNVGYFQAERLVRTEMSYVEGQADIHAYHEIGVTEYEFLATLDKRTTKVCQAMDRKKLPLNSIKVGVNYPPLHTFCRSTTIPLVEPSKIGQRIGRNDNNKNIKLKGNINYKDWLEKNVT